HPPRGDTITRAQRFARAGSRRAGDGEAGAMIMRTLRYMTRLAFAAAIAVSAAASFTAASFAQVKDYRQLKFPEMRPFAIPQPQRIVLDNGIVVMLLENHELPLIHVTARIRTGSRLEPADKAGLAADV